MQAGEAVPVPCVGRASFSPPATTPAGSQAELPDPKKSCLQLWARDRAPCLGLLHT